MWFSQTLENRPVGQRENGMEIVERAKRGGDDTHDRTTILHTPTCCDERFLR